MSQFFFLIQYNGVLWSFKISFENFFNLHSESAVVKSALFFAYQRFLCRRMTKTSTKTEFPQHSITLFSYKIPFRTHSATSSIDEILFAEVFSAKKLPILISKSEIYLSKSHKKMQVQQMFSDNQTPTS